MAICKGHDSIHVAKVSEGSLIKAFLAEDLGQ